MEVIHKKGMFVALIIIIFTVLLYMRAENKVPAVSNWTDVKEHWYDNVPGLKRAEELGLTREFDVKVDIPKTGHQLKITEVWYNSEQVYIFYGVNGIKDQTKLPRLDFLLTTPTNHEGDSPRNDTYGFLGDSGIMHDGWMYNVAVADPIIKVEMELDEVKEIVLEDVSVQKQNIIHRLEDPIQLTVHYSKDQERTRTLEVQKSVPLLNGEVALEKMTLSTSKLLLDWKVIGIKDPVKNLKGSIRAGESKLDLWSFETVWDNQFQMKTSPSDSEPENIEVHIDSVEFIGDDQFSFTLDTKEYTESTKDFEKELNREITTIKDTMIVLKKIILRDGRFHLMLDYKQKNNQSNVYLKGNLPNLRWPGQKEINREFPKVHLMEIINENGVHLTEHEGAFGGPENEFGLEVPRDFINKSDKLHITVENLLYEVQLDKTLHIKVP